MSTRRRPGSWQDEVAKSFSRFFSRSPSQDKEEEGAGEEPERSDRSLSRFFSRGQSQDRGQSQEEQERSPSRLSLRKDTNGGDRGQSQEEQDRAKGFYRTSSQEEQGEEQHRHEEKDSNLAPDIHEILSSGQTEEVKEDKSSSPPFQVTSESEEEKDTEYSQNSKVLDSEKQSRENFFHFIGNLFHFSPKTSLGNAKQVDSTQDLCKEHEDTQVKNNLDKEDSHQEHTQEVSASETEQTAEFSPAQAGPSVESNSEISKETIKQEQQETPPSRPKLNGYPQEAPAVTYGTYRGSRRIRKLLKRRADVNSPIPEREEISEKETSITGDVEMENHDLLQDIVSMEPVTCRSSEEEMPPSKMLIKMKMQPKVPAATQNGESNSQVEVLEKNAEGSSEVSIVTKTDENNLHKDEDLKQNSEDGSIVSGLSQNGEYHLHKDKDLKQNSDDGSIVSGLSQNGEYNLHEGEVLKQNAESGSVVFVSNCEAESNSHNVDIIQKPEVISMMSVSKQQDESFSDKVEDLKENVEENSSVLWCQEPNFIERTTMLEDIEESTKESPKISNNVQIHAEKRSDMSVDLSLDNKNSSNIYKEFVPNSEKNANISKDLQPNTENKSSCSVEPVSTSLFKISSDLLPNPEISENLPVNAEKNLNSSKVLQLKRNNELNFNSNLSPQNDNSSNISVDVQENSEKELKLLEDLQPNDLQKNSVESMPISGDVQRKEEERPNVLENFQTNSEQTSKILETLQPSKDESPKSQYELKQVFEKSSETAEENVMDFQPIATENTKTVNTSENVSLLPNHLHLNSKEDIEIQENWQVIPEKSTSISVDPCLKDLKLADSSQSSQENSSSNVTEDLHTNTSRKKELREHQSEQTYIKKHFEKVEEKLERLLNSVDAISESKLNTGRPLTSEKDPTQEAAFNAESNFDNQQRSTKENAPLIEIENLRWKELQLNVQENKSISEQSQPKVEEMPKITANLQPYENMHLDIQKDSEQDTEENCKLEEENTEVISESTVGPTIQSRDTEQDIFTNGTFTEKENIPNGQVKSTMDKKIVNSQPSLKVSEEPQTMANEIPMIIEQQHKHVDICDDTLNEFNMAPLANNDTLGTILVHENAQGSISDVKPVPETFLNKGSSFVEEPARTGSFDNGIECQSPSPTISGSPCSSSDCTDIRFDSPLPLSDAIDSGMVSSQAYTPEEQMTIKIFPPEIFNKSISVPFNIDQEDKKTEHVESKIENVENPLLASPLLHNAVKTQNEPLIEETESRTGANSSTREFLEDSGVADMYGNVSGRLSTNHRMKVNVNSDVYVAKVSVKSVNIEEVKLPPFEYHSDIVSIAKVESATFEKELIRFPNSSPPPLEPEYDSNFKDSNFSFQQDEQEENIVTNSEVPSDINEKDLTVNNVNLPFNESRQFLDCNNYEKSPHSCYMEAERFPALNKIDVVENVVNLFSNDYVGDNIPQHTFLEKGLPVLPDKSSDVLIENLKNNNLTIDTSDDIINISLQTNTSENDLTNESLMSDDSHWELQSCDSLSEFHPNGDLTYKEPVKENDIILQTTFQRDVNFTDDINSSDFATSKMSLPSTDHSELSTELFEKKANEIILSVLHTAIDEFQNLNKNHVNALSLGTVKETLAEKMVKDYSSEDEAEAPEKSSKNMKSLTTDPFISIVASGLVNDVINSSKQYMQSSLDKNIGTNNSCTQTSMVSVNGPDENTTNPKDETFFLLDIDSPVLFSSYEVNSNVLLPTPTSGSVEGTRENNGFKRVGDTEDILNDSSYLDGETSHNGVSGQDDGYTNLEAMIQGDTENKNVTFDLELDGDQGGYYSKSLETEGSMNTPFIDNLLSENMCISGTDEIDSFQFSLYNSKYVEIESDDEEEYGDNGHASATDFLTVPSRRVKIYPFSLSPIYEDDSSCEDAASSNSSPRHKLGTTGSGSNDHTSILSLLQSVSDRLKEANIEEMCFGGNLTFLSEAATLSALDNTDASVTWENIPAPTKSNLNAQKTPLEETTSGGKKSGLFITKAENKVNSGSGRQSLFLNLASQSSTVGAKSSVENGPKAASESEPSPSTSSESSSIQYKDLSPDVAPVTPLSPLQMVTDSGFSSLKPEIKCQPRMSSQSVYYQYFHSSQNYSHSKENKESPTEEKVDLPTNKESKETEDLLTSTIDSSCLKFNPRPGKVILSDVVHHENKIELNGDALDATSWVFPNGVNIRVIRGCWILYEKPHFEGQAHVLEEGEAVLLHLWDPPGARAKPDKISIGSVKRVVKDFFPEVIISPLEDTSDSPVHIHTEVPSLEHLVDKRPRSLTVNSGVWLTYKEPQYNGAVSVLEEGCDLPQIQACGVKSMRPLKMGGLKVQLPNDPKIIIYEKPHFQGWSREITEHVSSIGKLISDEDNTDPLDVGSIRIVGGIWVGYEKERYKGYQYLLEEGEYEDCQAWGGYSSTFQSIRYLQANFLEASVSLLESDSEDGKHVDLFNQAIPDLELAGYNTRPQCIHVKKGMWVAYQQKHYCGEQYILEKGRYKTHVDWGGSSNTIMSIRPVLLEPLGRSEVKHLIKAYESTNFQGESVDITQQVSDFISFMPKSFKVLRGCWLLGYQADACDNVCVLEEGHFPDLASCGCPAAEIKYIRPMDYVFAEPSISLFALDSCEGREMHFEEAVTSVLNKDLHFYTQSVWVRRGLWIAFEGANFLGRQMLLESQQILNWSKFSGWKAIGSLRPLKQPAVYFMVRNRHRDKYLTVTGKLSDTRATFVSVSSRNGQSSQIWYFTRGFLKSKANDLCLDIIGGKNIPESKVSLWAEHGKTRQKWKINKDGTISSYISDDLVLDVKGGNYYDQNFLIVNRSQENALTQKWDIEIL